MNELENTLAQLRTIIADCQNVVRTSPTALHRKVAADVLPLLQLVEAEVVGLLQREGADPDPEERAATMTRIAAQFKSVRDYLENQAAGKPH